MSLRIRPATPSDIPAIAIVGAAAFEPSSDAIVRNLFPPHLQPGGTLLPGFQQVWREGRKTLQLADKDNVVLVAVSGEEAQEVVVGFAVWTAPHEGESPERPPPPETMDKKALEEIVRSVKETEKAVFGERGARDSWYLDFLGVDPKYGRRGAGRMMLNWGMERAAEEGRDCYLLATPAGRPLYAAAGFEEVGMLVIFGMPHPAMIIKHDKRWGS